MYLLLYIKNRFQLPRKEKRKDVVKEVMVLKAEDENMDKYLFSLKVFLWKAKLEYRK